MFQWLKKPIKAPEPEFRLAKLPPRRNELDSPILPASHIYDDIISKAVELFRANPDVSDTKLYRQLVELGAERAIATRLIVFLPIVYGRLFLVKAGVKVSDMFFRPMPDGKLSPKRPLSGDPVWLSATQFARQELDRGVSPADIELLAKRSPEVQVARESQSRGSELLLMSPPVFCWPEQGWEE